MADKYSVYRDKWDRLKAENEAAMAGAGILEVIKNLPTYSDTFDLRAIYFAVPDLALRKAAISAHRRLMLHVENNYYESQIQDEMAILNKARMDLNNPPWKFPAFSGCAAVWLGYSFFGLSGALGGALIGFFAGQAYVNNSRQVARNAISAAEGVIASYRKEQAEDRAETEIERSGFTLAEEMSGEKQEW
jgi:hypothetical protein